MIVIGELINATRKKVAEALKEKNAIFFRNLARKQVEAGADVIDVNAGIGKDEPVCMEWLVKIIQEVVDKPLCIDTTDPAVLEAGLKKCKQPPWINSISGESKRLEEFMPLIKRYDFSGIIALAVDDRGISNSYNERVRACIDIMESVRGMNDAINKLFFDPLVLPISVNNGSGEVFIETLNLLRRHNMKTIAAISNISHGLPQRSILNKVLATMAVRENIDAVIINPLDFELMASIKATNLLLGKDHRCRKYTKYIKKYKKN